MQDPATPPSTIRSRFRFASSFKAPVRVVKARGEGKFKASRRRPDPLAVPTVEKPVALTVPMLKSAFEKLNPQQQLVVGLGGLGLIALAAWLSD